MDDSLCRLLPNEKPRQKKDFGTTSYKKPGPPTPSKNGGRLSLQGNEVQPLREQNQRMTTPKKVTPSRIRALFMGRTNISRDNTEVDIDYFIDMIDECLTLNQEIIRNTDSCCCFVCSRLISKCMINRLYISSTSICLIGKILCFQALLINKIWIYAKHFFAYCIFLLWRSDTVCALLPLKNVSKILLMFNSHVFIISASF